MKELKNTYLLNTMISKNRLIVIEERATEEGIPFVLVYNLYLTTISTYDSMPEAIKALCATTCSNNRLSKNYLRDVEYFVHSFSIQKGTFKL